MRTPLLLRFAMLAVMIAVPEMSADQLEMQNGDRYQGKVVSVSTDNVVWESDVLGKINLPRKKVAAITFGTPAVAAQRTGVVATLPLTNFPTAASTAALLKTNSNSLVTARNLSANSSAVRQVREQMLAGSPEAAGKFDELVNGLMTGKISMNDLRSQAKSSADQLRALKHELGPEMGDSLDAYLNVLDSFLKESAAEPVGAPALAPKTQLR